MNPTEKAILDLYKRLEICERRVRNLVRVGEVAEVVGAKCVIDYEPNSDNDYKSPLIKWLPVFAGDALDWRAPTVGEAMIVLNLSGGEDESNCVALSPMYCDGFSPDSTDPNAIYTRFHDVFRVETDSQGNHTLFAKKSIAFNTESFSVNASSDVNVNTKSYSRNASTATTKGEHSQTGNVKIKGALDVSISVKTPAIASYVAGAFSMDGKGAVINNVSSTSIKINGKPIEGHTHGHEYGDTDPF